MPKLTPTQELTARILSVLPGWKPEEQFFALLNAASHVHANRGEMDDPQWREKFLLAAMQFWNYMHPDEFSILEPLSNEDNEYTVRYTFEGRAKVPTFPIENI